MSAPPDMLLIIIIYLGARDLYLLIANNMKYLFIAILVLLVSGCVNSSLIRTANGKVGYTINCRDAWFGAYSTSDCYQRAGEVCPNGYVVLGNESTQHFTSSSNQYGSHSGTYNARVLTVECKAPEQASIPVAPESHQDDFIYPKDDKPSDYDFNMLVCNNKCTSSSKWLEKTSPFYATAQIKNYCECSCAKALSHIPIHLDVAEAKACIEIAIRK